MSTGNVDICKIVLYTIISDTSYATISLIFILQTIPYHPTISEPATSLGHTHLSTSYLERQIIGQAEKFPHDIMPNFLHRASFSLSEGQENITCSVQVHSESI